MSNTASDSKLLDDINRVARSAKISTEDLPRQVYGEHGSFNSSTIERRFGSWSEAKELAAARRTAFVSKEPKKDIKGEILQVYLNLVKSGDSDVTQEDLANFGVTKDMVRHHYGSLSSLDSIARAASPKTFKDVDLGSLFSPKALHRLRDAVSGYKRFVVTTAVVGCEADKAFYGSLKNYCKLNDAALLVLVVADPAARTSSGGYGNIDKLLSNEYIVMEDTAINNNLFVSTIKLSAKHIDPITGLGRIGQQNGSFIYASPKQRMKPVAVSNSKMPHVIMTTGAITKPSYGTDRYLSERTAYIAEHDHVMGAVIVEVENEEIFHFRQVQASKKDGSIVDLGVRYSQTATSKVKPEAFVLGDWHSGETDPVASKCWFDVIKALKPKRVVLHDAFNGHSINHHEHEQQLTRAVRAAQSELDLGQELTGLAHDLAAFAAEVDEVVMVKSNHDEFLGRYLQKGSYVDDAMNHRLCLQLAIAMLDGHDPLRYGIEHHAGVKLPNVRWLGRDEDYKVAKIQLGAHGDKGPNGARGNLQNMEAAYGSSVTGHSHTPEILRGAWSVGTSSKLKLMYNVGPSSWMHTSCLIYPDGSRQLINVIFGKWKL